LIKNLKKFLENLAHSRITGKYLFKHLPKSGNQRMTSRTTDLFEQTTRASRGGYSASSSANRSRDNSALPTPTLSRDVSVDQNLDSMPKDSMTLTQKLKNYFRALDYGPQIRKSKKKEGDDEDSDDYDDDESDNEDQLEETGEDEDENDILNSTIQLQYSFQHFPKQSMLLNHFEGIQAKKSTFSSSPKSVISSFLPFFHCQESVLSSLLIIIKEELFESLSKIAINNSNLSSSVFGESNTAGEGGIQLLPLWEFYRKKSFLRRTEKKGVPQETSKTHPAGITTDTRQAETKEEGEGSMDLSYFFILWLNQCMERSNKDSIHEMINSFQNTLLYFISSHPVISKILPEVMITSSVSSSGSSYAPSSPLPTFSIKSTSGIAMKSPDEHDYIEEEKHQQENHNHHHPHCHEERKIEFLCQLLINDYQQHHSSSFCFHSPDLLIFFLALLQSKQHFSHFLFSLLSSRLVSLTRLFPSNISQWSSPFSSFSASAAAASSMTEETILEILDLSSQLQLILSILNVKANDLLEIQKYSLIVTSSSTSSVTMMNDSTDNDHVILSAASLDHPPQHHQHHEATAPASLEYLLSHHLWHNVERFLLQYRIIIPLLSLGIRQSIIFISIYQRFDTCFLSSFVFLSLSHGFRLFFYSIPLVL
jgi:hypothetical protein